MFQLYKNIQTDFLGQIFLELFQFKTRSLFWDTLYIPVGYPVPSMGFSMLYVINRLAINQSNFLKACRYELVI